LVVASKLRDAAPLRVLLALANEDRTLGAGSKQLRQPVEHEPVADVVQFPDPLAGALRVGPALAEVLRSTADGLVEQLALRVDVVVLGDDRSPGRFGLGAVARPQPAAPSGTLFGNQVVSK
jgi:hypothetical protein